MSRLKGLVFIVQHKMSSSSANPELYLPGKPQQDKDIKPQAQQWQCGKQAFARST